MNGKNQNVNSINSPNARLAINTKDENEKSLSTEKICRVKYYFLFFQRKNHQKTFICFYLDLW